MKNRLFMFAQNKEFINNERIQHNMVHCLSTFEK